MFRHLNRVIGPSLKPLVTHGRRTSISCTKNAIPAGTSCMNRGRLSIGLPVYNGEKYLEAAVRSLLAQTYSDFELIISDNASSDRTQEICQDFAASDSRVRYYRNERNIGANPNFNRVLELATGEFFKWAAYDDICRPQYLEKCIEALDANPSIILCHTRTAIINEDGCRVDTSPEGLAAIGVLPNEISDPPRKLDAPTPYQRFREILLYSKWCFEIFGVMRTSVLPSRRPLEEYYGTDKVFMAMLALRGRIYDVDEELFLRRHHAAQSSYIESSVRAKWVGSSGRESIGTTQRKCLGGYRHAIQQVEMSAPQRLACYGLLFRYVLQLRKWPRVVGLARPRHLRL